MSELERYYEILGVNPNASSEEVRRAYRRLALDYHPDRQAGATDAVKRLAGEKFIEVNEAYEVLSDHAKREQNDRSRVREDVTPRSETSTGGTAGHEPKRPRASSSSKSSGPQAHRPRWSETSTGATEGHEPKRPRTSSPRTSSAQSSPPQPTAQERKRSEFVRLHIAAGLLAIAAIPTILWVLANLLAHDDQSTSNSYSSWVNFAIGMGVIFGAPSLVRFAHSQWDMWCLQPRQTDNRDETKKWTFWLFVAALPAFFIGAGTFDYVEPDPLSIWAWFGTIVAFPSRSISLFWLLVVYPASIFSIRGRYR